LRWQLERTGFRRDGPRESIGCPPVRSGLWRSASSSRPCSQGRFGKLAGDRIRGYAPESHALEHMDLSLAEIDDDRDFEQVAEGSRLDFANESIDARRGPGQRCNRETELYSVIQRRFEPSVLFRKQIVGIREEVAEPVRRQVTVDGD